ncbi:MAG: PKD domain-containing protein, partial [Acutalibacteraceae bacterium]|nr:PKD domain-containing protein [Acutalibacteraceae bacterium]
AKVANVKIEYKTDALFSTYTTLKETTNNSANCRVSAKLPVESLSNGTKVTVQVSATDVSGNEAEIKTATYTIDTEAPVINSIELVKDENSDKENSFNINWTLANADDVYCFYIYKQTNKDNSYVLYDTLMAEKGKTQYTYNDDEFKSDHITVKYKIEAYDSLANFSSAETDIAEVAHNIKPTVVIDCNPTVIAESEYLYDASASTDDGTIVSYTFDFGNGTVKTNSNGTIIYAYDSVGTYTLQVIATDNDGNMSVAEKTITVTGRELVGTLTVNVVDDSNRIIPNAPVYLNLGEAGEQKAITDNRGNVTFKARIGTHTVASYKEDYLPVKQQVVVTGGQRYVQLTLVNQPIVTGEFEIHKMTLDEIKAAGIDINAAENRHVVKLNVTLVYEEKPINTTVYWNGSNTYYEPVYVNTSGGTRKLTPTVIGGGHTGGGGSYNTEYVENPTLVYIDVPVEFSYLKDFFDVQLHIVNHASEEFSLRNNTVTLNVPSGLTVMDTAVSEKQTVMIPEIQGQSQKTIKWILRGDKAGEYKISADFLGTLSYFNEPVSATFVADDPIKVEDTTSVKVEVEACSVSYEGKVFYNVVVQNNSASDYYDFRWTNAIEPFLSEHVNADGDHEEMLNQLDTLKSKEKFVYHYFQQFSTELSYYDNIIEDLNNNGATVVVSIHPPEYFLDSYFDAFPEEKGEYVFRVKDSKGNPISGAKITLTNALTGKDSSITTDSRGIASLGKKAMAGGMLKVTRDGYQDYIEYNYFRFGWGNSDTIVLYEESEFVIEEVYFDDVDVLKEKTKVFNQRMDVHGIPDRILMKVLAYGDIKSIELIQNGKAITTAIADSILEGNHRYVQIILPQQFIADEPVSIKATAVDASGKEKTIVKELLVEVSDTIVTDLVNVPVLDSLSITIPADVTLMGGLSLEFDGAALNKVSIAYDKRKDTFIYGFNIDLTSFADSATFASSMMQYVKDFYNWEMYNPTDTSLFQGFGLKPGFDVVGAIEVKIDDNDNYSIVNADVSLVASLGISFHKLFFPGGVPLDLGVELNVGGGVKANLSYKTGSKIPDFSFGGFIASAKFKLTFGVGVKVLSAGIYGAIGGDFEFNYVHPDMKLNKIILNGAVGFYAQLLAFRVEAPVLSFKDKVVYSASEARAKIAKMMSSAYDQGSYTLDENIRELNSAWSKSIKANSGTTKLLENVYAGSAPQIITNGDTTVMVYMSANKDASNTINSLAMYYSVYNNKTGEWSAPQKVHNKNTLDMSYSLCSDGNKIYLVYTGSKSVLSANASITDMVGSAEVYTAYFDTVSKKFTGIEQLTNNSIYESTPVIETVNGVPTVTWISSDSNNPFLTDNDNSIYTSRYENGKWSTPNKIGDNLCAVQNLSVAEGNKDDNIVYTVDADGDLSTTGDKTLYVYSSYTGKTTKLAENLESAVDTITIANNSVVMWCSNGKLMQYSFKTGKTDTICSVDQDVANGFKLVTDNNGNYALVYVKDRTNICAMYLDTATLIWSKPVTVVTGDKYIEQLEAEYVNGNLTLVYNDTTVVESGDRYAVSSDLVTTTVVSDSKPVITKLDVDYALLTPNKTSKVNVEVTNKGAKATGNLTFTVTNYDGMKLGTYTTTDVSLKSGESDTYEVEFIAPEIFMNKDITVLVTDENKEYVGSKSFSLGLCDLALNSKFVTEDDTKYLFITVSNNLFYSSPAVLEIFNKETEEVYYSTRISNIMNGIPKQIMLEFDEKYVDEKGCVSIKIKPQAKDDNNYNNIETIKFSEIKENTELSGITVNGTAIKDFAVDKTEYTITVKDTANVQIVPVFDNASLTYT